MLTQQTNTLNSPTPLNWSLTSETSIASKTVADPVVRYITVLHRTKNLWRTLYSLTSDTAQLLLQGEMKKKKLEKTNKKAFKKQKKGTFGQDITQKIEELEPKNFRKISDEVNREILQEDTKIRKESSKLVKSLLKMRLKVGQRLPINSKVCQGKWFLQLVETDLLILVLTFAGSDEVSVGRLLKKITSALVESSQELENPGNVKRDIDKVVRNYGFYNFENKNVMIPPSKVVLEETLVNNEEFVRSNKLNNIKTVRKIKEFSEPQYMEEVDPKQIPDFSTCESPMLVKLVKPPVRASQKIIENFFKSEPIQTPKKPHKKKIKRNVLNLDDISKIEIKTEDFDDKNEDMDFFEFEVTKEDDDKIKELPEKAFAPPPMSPPKLCIDLSKKFERCVYNHKVMNSASKQIKNFDSEHFTNFSSSAKKMITRGHNFEFSSNNKPRKLSGNRKIKRKVSINSNLILEKPKKKVSFNSKEFWARLGLGCLLLMVFVVMMKMFLEVNGGGSAVKDNEVTYEHGGGGKGGLFR